MEKVWRIKIVRARVGISGSFSEIFFRDQDVLPDTRDRAASYPRARLSPVHRTRSPTRHADSASFYARRRSRSAGET